MTYLAYRGAMLAGEEAETNSPPLSRQENIPRLLGEKTDINPHAEEYAEQFLWASNDADFAKRTIQARLLTQIAIDPDFRERLARGEILPTLTMYEIEDPENLYTVENKKLQPFAGETSTEMIIGKADKGRMWVMSPESLKHLIDTFVVNPDYGTDMGDRLLMKVVHDATKGLGVVDAEDKADYEQFKGKTAVEQIQIVNKLGLEFGFKQDELNEMIASQMFKRMLEPFAPEYSSYALPFDWVLDDLKKVASQLHDPLYDETRQETSQPPK